MILTWPFWNTAKYAFLWCQFIFNTVPFFVFNWPANKLAGHKQNISNWCYMSKQSYFAGCAQTLPDAAPPIAKIPLFQQNFCNFWTKFVNFDILWDLEFPRPVWHSLFYDWSHNSCLAAPWTEISKGVNHWINHWIKTVFVEQPLTLLATIPNL